MNTYTLELIISRLLIKYIDGPQPGNTEHKPADDWYHDISYSGFTPGDEGVEVLDFGGDEVYFVMANPEYDPYWKGAGAIRNGCRKESRSSVISSAAPFCNS